MLVIQPIGGQDDWGALFHEAGHTEHYAHTSPTLPMEARRLGDMAVTEGWAMLIAAPRRRARVAEPAARRAAGRASSRTTAPSSLLYFVRRYARSSSTRSSSSRPRTSSAMRSRYAEILGDALKLPVEPRELPRRHRRLASTSPATCARGRSRRSCATSCAASSATSGSRAARPATCCASSGRSARARRPTSC